MKKVLVLLEDVSFEQKTVVEARLAEYDAQFAHSIEDVIAHCDEADIIALSTKNESYVPALFECGFKDNGIIIPLLVNKKCQGMMVRDKTVPAIPVRDLPGIVDGIIAELEPITA